MSALVVTVGVALGADEHDVAALTHALREAALDVTGRFAVDEDEVMLERALTMGAAVTVVVAGSGSSSGDVVRRTLARIASARLLLSERALDALTERYRRRDRPLPRRAERLALFPQGAVLWLSPESDPAFALEMDGRVIAVLPRGGDLAAIVRQHLVPFLAERTGAGEAVLTRTLRTAGVSIADVEERLTEAGARADGSEATITVLPAASGDFEVWVRIAARGPGAAERLARVDHDVAEVLGEDCYGRDDETLERVVGRLLLERGLTLSVAESCTSGLLGHRLTDIPASSAYFERGVLVYSNQAKQDLLGVPEEILSAHGAVSAPCAEAMARGICAASGNPVGLAVTGVAGPDGGSAQKPVGTVFIGLAVAGD
ncbi:MAG TPA: nicotinamide-nucleotide amidohydrolase family protein, partial [Solirubrobacteraceae bacterium]